MTNEAEKPRGTSEPILRLEPPTRPEPVGPPALDARSVHKSYRSGDGSELHVLRGIDLRIETGEAVAIIGASGAGKSTLLHLLGALDTPTIGEILLGGTSLKAMEGKAIAAARNRHLGFVFQFHHLLREFTALENVMMPCLIAGMPRTEARRRAEALLDEVGLAARMEHRPWQLSGGEQQRVAVARALANEPLVLLADEPSGNLDHHSAGRLHDTLFQMRGTHRLSLVLVTHNLELARRADRILLLEDGVLVPADLG
jgi:lipoprotein-releasing system ATP-binding protein